MLQEGFLNTCRGGRQNGLRFMGVHSRKELVLPTGTGAWLLF